ncbi:cytidine deaminase [Hoeflea prorocentri]|uniref:Cytidine deaminase n=1 Tax=Hoeflea prorocentri TaxID=1922333 RepID=A0A9X3UPF8_9HYPH|nr:cytidine deaminase [Hoeflea prorocentri]MCY6382984.1 cytidine deaminase [Hoeflea prorocentri]MDA5400784.1 cytidine deaminase [Hoeflea prorocentri]
MSSDLFEAARDAMSRCHTPYSHFPVGAALRADDGRIYAGANIEVISYPEGWCAETTAISHMVMGGGKQIEEVAVIAEKMEACTPCGGCRQRLAEFGGPDTKIHLCDMNGIVKTITLGELLPLAFDAEVLK